MSASVYVAERVAPPAPLVDVIVDDDHAVDAVDSVDAVDALRAADAAFVTFVGAAVALVGAAAVQCVYVGRCGRGVAVERNSFFSVRAMMFAI